MADLHSEETVHHNVPLVSLPGGGPAMGRISLTGLSHPQLPSDPRGDFGVCFAVPEFGQGGWRYADLRRHSFLGTEPMVPGESDD